MAKKGRKGRKGRGARGRTGIAPEVQQVPSARFAFPDGAVPKTGQSAPADFAFSTPPGSRERLPSGEVVTSVGAAFNQEADLRFGALPAATDPFYIVPAIAPRFDLFAKVVTPIFDLRDDLEQPAGIPRRTRRYRPDQIMVGLRYDAFIQLFDITNITDPLRVVLVYFGHTTNWDRVQAVTAPVDITADYYALNAASGSVAFRFPLNGPMRYQRVGLGIYAENDGGAKGRYSYAVH